VTGADERLDHVFTALADGTRRAVMRRLSEDGPATASALALELPMSRQAVVKHLQTLSRAGLVDTRRDGREVRYRATPAPLGDAVLWMVRTGATWDRRLERLRRQLSQRTGSP
jgi:DNA-binding transcriptional ArsR family regulator